MVLQRIFVKINKQGNVIIYMLLHLSFNSCVLQIGYTPWMIGWFTEEGHGKRWSTKHINFSIPVVQGRINLHCADGIRTKTIFLPYVAFSLANWNLQTHPMNQSTRKSLSIQSPTSDYILACELRCVVISYKSTH
jgi:hypothetical protein